MQPAFRIFASITLLLSSLVACSSTPNLYRWGIYEPMLYQSFIEPGAAQPDQQAIELSAEIQRSEAEGYRVPPGVHAHLGSLYLAQGDSAQARASFLREKELYPESSVFIDRLLKKNNQLK